MPTLRFGKAIAIFEYVSMFFGTGFGAIRDAVRSGFTRQSDKGRLLVLESDHFLERATDTLASVREFLRRPRWETGSRGLRESPGVDLGW